MKNFMSLFGAMGLIFLGGMLIGRLILPTSIHAETPAENQANKPAIEVAQKFMAPVIGHQNDLNISWKDFLFRDDPSLTLDFREGLWNNHGSVAGTIWGHGIMGVQAIVTPMTEKTVVISGRAYVPYHIIDAQTISYNREPHVFYVKVNIVSNLIEDIVHQLPN